MAVENILGTNIITGLDAVPAVHAPPGLGGGIVRSWCETLEVDAAASANSTYELARLPSNARILGASCISWDDLASAGAPTLDIGVFNLSGATDITDDDDAINDGMDAAAAAARLSLIKVIDNYGLPLWDFVNGQTVDPKCMLSIKATLKDAAVNAGGTIRAEIYYTLD